MPRYRFTVFEMRAVEMIYEVEADSEEAAAEKAERGDAIGEEFVRELGVNSREVEGLATGAR